LRHGRSASFGDQSSVSPGTGRTARYFGHTRSLLDTLGLLIAADEAHGEPQTWSMMHTGGMGPRAWAGVGGWPDDAEVPSEHTIDELAERGFVRVLRIKGNGRTFAITGAGRDAWAKHQADGILDIRAIDLTWESARTTLERIYALYRSARGPMGVPITQLTQDPESGAQAEAQIEHLIQAGYLEVGRDSSAGPTHVRPTELTLQMLDGWPGSLGEEALRGLVAALNAEIEQTTDDDKRSKLIQVRDGLRGVARDLVLTYLRGDVQALPHHLPHL
jgi:hypothetical protein